VFILNTSTDAEQTLLQNATVKIDSYSCDPLPATTVKNKWYRVTCKTSFDVQYRAGSYVTITSTQQGQTLWIAGVKVFGYQSEVSPSTAPRACTSIEVDNNGDPYVINDKAEIYQYKSSSWTKKGDVAKAIAVDPSNALWKI
jgi:hypothetical protein